MKTITFNEQVQVVFAVPSSLHNFYVGMLTTNGLEFQSKRVMTTTEFTIKAQEFNEQFISLLANIFCYK